MTGLSTRVHVFDEVRRRLAALNQLVSMADEMFPCDCRNLCHLALDPYDKTASQLPFSCHLAASASETTTPGLAESPLVEA